MRDTKGTVHGITLLVYVAEMRYSPWVDRNKGSRSRAFLSSKNRVLPLHSEGQDFFVAESLIYSPSTPRVREGGWVGLLGGSMTFQDLQGSLPWSIFMAPFGNSRSFDMSVQFENALRIYHASSPAIAQLSTQIHRIRRNAAGLDQTWWFDRLNWRICEFILPSMYGSLFRKFCMCKRTRGFKVASDTLSPWRTERPCCCHHRDHSDYSLPFEG